MGVLIFNGKDVRVAARASFAHGLAFTRRTNYLRVMEQVNQSFKNWKAQEVEKAFGIKRTKKSVLLDRWLDARPSSTERQWDEVERLRQSAEDNVDAWNEAALKFFFIGPLVSQVNFNTDGYSGFLEQTLVISNETVSARGNVDFMVAAGRQIPEAPYYVLHEYKPETTTILDPQGQLLIAMLSAQRANMDIQLTQPIYGTYVLGRFWFFVILNGNEYTISKAFDSTDKNGVESIFFALLQVKVYIDALYEEVPQA